MGQRLATAHPQGAQRQELVYGRTDLTPPDGLVGAVRHPQPALVRRYLADNAAWAQADHLLIAACRVPGHEGHGGAIAAADKREADRVAVVELLVAHGAPPTLRNNRKVTPLHMACRFDLPGVAERLLRLGAEANAYDAARETPLFRAVNLGYAACVQALLAGGADVNFQNRRGETPLHRAVMRGKRRIVPLLLAAGADPRIADRAGKPPPAYARSAAIRTALLTSA